MPDKKNSDFWNSVKNVRSLEEELIPGFSKYDLEYENVSVRFMEAYTEKKVSYKGKISAPHLVLTYIINGYLEFEFEKGFKTTLKQNHQYTYYLPGNNYVLTYPPESFIHWVRIILNKKFIEEVVSQMFNGADWVKHQFITDQCFIDRDGLMIHPKVIQCLTEMRNPPVDAAFQEMYVMTKILELVSFNFSYDSTKSFIQIEGIPYRDLIALNQLKDYLNLSYLKKQNLKGLSKKFGLNEFKLKKGFKAIFGTTVFGYINDLKMNKAKNLLQEGLNVSEVSMALGYSYPQHFSVAYKKKFGNSPTQEL